MSYICEGKKEPGIPSIIVPTVEEAVVQDRLPPGSQAEHPPLKDKLEHQLGGNSDPVEKRTANGKANGAPALALKNPQTGDEPLHLESGANDLDTLEKTSLGTKTLPRKHLTSKVGNKVWTVSIPAPHVDPEGFEDPISDAFWKNVWIACATYNVCYLCLGVVGRLILFRRPRFIAKFSMLSPTTTFRRGSITKNLLFTMNASLSWFVDLFFAIPLLNTFIT